MSFARNMLNIGNRFESIVLKKKRGGGRKEIKVVNGDAGSEL